MNQLSLFEVPPRPAPQPVGPSTVKNGRPDVRYRHPGQPGMAWTGRGKPPRWITEWIESGKTLDELRVQGVGIEN